MDDDQKSLASMAGHQFVQAADVSEEPLTLALAAGDRVVRIPSR